MRSFSTMNATLVQGAHHNVILGLLLSRLGSCTGLWAPQRISTFPGPGTGCVHSTSVEWTVTLILLLPPNQVDQKRNGQQDNFILKSWPLGTEHPLRGHQIHSPHWARLMKRPLGCAQVLSLALVLSITAPGYFVSPQLAPPPLL